MYHNLSQPLLMLSEDALCMLLLLGDIFFWWVGVWWGFDERACFMLISIYHKAINLF